jgi:hypothetical protein
MGNLSIHHTSPVPLGSTRQLQPPPAQRTLWRVYPLRDLGVKQDQQTVLRRAQLGLLQLWRNALNTSLNAWLVHPSGYPTLMSLEHVQIARMEPGGGMLLHGQTLSTGPGGNQAYVPQAWWCVVHQLEPRPDPKKDPLQPGPEGVNRG